MFRPGPAAGPEAGGTHDAPRAESPAAREIRSPSKSLSPTSSRPPAIAQTVAILEGKYHSAFNAAVTHRLHTRTPTIPHAMYTDADIDECKTPSHTHT